MALDKLNSDLDRMMPILADLKFAYADHGMGLRLPSALKLAVSAACSVKGKSCAFILPQPQIVTGLVAYFAAIHSLRQDFENAITTFEKRYLKKNENVAVYPDMAVYKYIGRKENGLSGSIYLEMLGKGHSVPFRDSEILRLIPTKRKRPKGNGLIRHNIDLSDLDRFLEIATYNNPCLHNNKYIVYGSRANLDNCVSSFRLRKVSHKEEISFDKIPTGILEASGHFLHDDRYAAAGEPIIACSNHILEIAAHAEAISEKTKCILISSRQAIFSNLHAIERLTARQKVVIFLDRINSEEQRSLADTGILTWGFEEQERLSGIDSTALKPNRNIPLFYRIIAGPHKADLITIKSAKSEVHSDLFSLLNQISREVDSDDQKDRLLNLPKNIFWRHCELLSRPETESDDSIMSETGELKRKIDIEKRYLQSDCYKKLEQLNDKLLDLRADIRKHSDVKIRLLCEERASTNPAALMILARNLEAITAVKKTLPEFADVQMLIYSQYSARQKTSPILYDKVILLGWPGQDKFDSFCSEAGAKQIVLLAYPFEQKLAESYIKEQKAINQKFVISSADKSEITSLPEEIFKYHPEVVPAISASNATETVIQYDNSPDNNNLYASFIKRHHVGGSKERQVEAVCLGLDGDRYVLFPLGHKVSTICSAAGTFKRKNSEDVLPGDTIIMRRGAEKDIVREIAAALYPDSYEKDRANASLWKDWLFKIGNQPYKVKISLEDHGLVRSEFTIKSWLYDSELIAPLNLDDLNYIANVASKNISDSTIQSVINSIRKIRSHHIEAGHKLSEIIMSRLSGMNETEFMAKLGDIRTLADIDIYSVEKADDSRHNVAESACNIVHNIWTHTANENFHLRVSGEM